MLYWLSHLRGMRGGGGPELSQPGSQAPGGGGRTQAVVAHHRLHSHLADGAAIVEAPSAHHHRRLHLGLRLLPGLGQVLQREWGFPTWCCTVSAAAVQLLSQGHLLLNRCGRSCCKGRAH